MGWPPEDPDMWAVEARFKGRKRPDIQRSKTLDYNTDWVLNVVPHLTDGLTEAVEVKNDKGDVIGWNLQARAFPSRF